MTGLVPEQIHSNLESAGMFSVPYNILKVHATEIFEKLKMVSEMIASVIFYHIKKVKFQPEDIQTFECDMGKYSTRPMNMLC